MVSIRDTSAPSAVGRGSNLEPHGELHVGRDVRECVPVWAVYAAARCPAGEAGGAVYDEPPGVFVCAFGELEYWECAGVD